MSIKDAINKRLVVTFIYEDLPRTVEPHTYGRNKQHILMLSGYQTGGRSKSGKIPNFRKFNESQITQLKITSTAFNGTGPGYIRNDPYFEEILAQLK